MLIGIVGKPNVGKSTFFSAATLAPAEIADYPFTTIKSNKGVAYLRTRCPHLDLGHQCNPRNSACENGVRLVPVELLDVAGLVPDAWQGKGLGNQFLYTLMLGLSLYVYVSICLRLGVLPPDSAGTGRGKSRDVSIVVEKASLPAAVFEAPSSSAASAASADSVACPASAGLSQSTQTGEKTMETISAILLYMTKDAYYIKLRDGKTLSVKGDAVKSVVWDSVPK